MAKVIFGNHSCPVAPELTTDRRGRSPQPLRNDAERLTRGYPARDLLAFLEPQCPRRSPPRRWGNATT